MTSVKKQLVEIVGKKNVKDDGETLAFYAQDQSFVQHCMPDIAVYVRSTEHVQAVLRLANSRSIPVTPFSSGKNLHGAAVPNQGGIMLDMSQMKTIHAVDEKNLTAIIEPGVTYRELQDALLQKGFRIMVPFGVPPDRSVLTSYLERDVTLAAPSFENGNALVLDTELVLPSGEIFKTGAWATGGNPGTPMGPVRTLLFRLWTGAQGTLGVMTRMNIQIDRLPPERKILFMPHSSLEEASETIARIQRKEIGLECLLLNSFNLAALFAGEWSVPDAFPAGAVPSDEFERMRRELSPWAVIVCLSGLPRHPEEKIAYEEEALREIADVLNVEVMEGLPGLPAAGRVMLDELLRPWGILRKYNFKGSVHDLTFKAPVDESPLMEQTLRTCAEAEGYPTRDIGVYMVPLERGRGMHCEFDLHSNPEDEIENARIKKLWLNASEELMNRGAYFDRPYGQWAPLVYNRAAMYTAKLKLIKQELDPNNILNPGKLCFS